MNSINEKEKKLNIALDKLKNLDLSNPDLQNNVENLSAQKTQLEIEKSQLEKKYNSLLLNLILTFAIYQFLPINYLFPDLIHQFFLKTLSVFLL